MPAKLGIVAGGGTLPARLIEACRAHGRPFHVLAFRDHADPVPLADAPADWIRLGEAGGVVDLLRRAGVSEVVMAGPIRRPSLAELRPDWRTVRLVARLGAHSIGDDGLLRAVVREFEIEGFRVIGINDVLDDLVATIGPYGRIEPDEQGWDDIRRGVSVARALGVVDVGQSVVVQQGLVLGVEAIEGTDALIARCAGLKREGPGGVLVKLPKPGQERRADLPTVGVATLRNAAAAGLRGVAVEAGGTLVVGRDEVAAAADQLGLFVIGVAP